MAHYLYRIGRFAFRRRGLVIASWLVLLALAAVGAATLSGPTKDTFSIPGTPAQRAQDLLAERFPGAADPGNSLSARYVFAAPAGETLEVPANQAAMGAVLDRVRALPRVPEQAKETLVDPVAARQRMVEAAAQKGAGAVADAQALAPLSPDRTVGYLDVPLTGGVTDSSDELRAAIDAAAQVGRAEGLTVEVSGTATQNQQPPGGATELVGIGVAAIVLMITFGSLVAAGLPLITAIIGIAIGSLGISIATGFTDLSSMTPTLAVMIGLAVAIDYSLFIVSRYRHELTHIVGSPDRESRAAAAGRAVGTAGSAVVFAGLTVIIALIALRVVGIPFLADMGAAAAFTVFLAVLIALTLLPALLGLLGARVFAGRVPFLRANDPSAVGAQAQRYARFVTRRPAWVLAVAVLALGVVAMPASQLELALPNQATSDPAASPRKAYDLIDRGFGPGRNGPLLVVVDGSAATGGAHAAFDIALSTISADPDVTNAQIVRVNQTGDTAQILVTPRSGPSSDETKNLVQRLRDAEPGVRERTAASFGVTGQTALENDVSARLRSALVPYLAVVVGLAFVLLMLVFRSVLVPLTATLGFLLSVVATFGATVAIWQEGWGGLTDNPQPLVSFLPIFLIGVVFGLAMDYQVFLVTRMREEYTKGASARDAIVAGFGHGARVVTAAAIIMMSVFAAFIAEDQAFIRVMGFALAIAVFFDAFVVRMVIIPAVMALLGDRAWYLPTWLDRILPDVDIEGGALTDDSPRDDERELVPAH